MKTKSLLLATALLMSTSALAQKNTFKGVVLDDLGEPVIGATVQVKGVKGAGAITDLDGNFVIDADANQTLVITYIGYKDAEIRPSANMKITLKQDDKALDEVVVVGYGVQKKSVVTAAIAKVSTEDLAGKSPVRVDNALKGLAAGVNVTSSSGQPGEGSKVRVRGTGTINNSDPLYIVDGMPIEGGLDYLNPSDIESIEVLKDAASGAIYGARAANGVILVTTKKGKMGKAQINYNFSYGWQSAWKKRDVTSATDYAILQNERAVNGGQAPVFADPYALTDSNGKAINGFGTDWQNLVFNDNAPVQNHEVSISGASEKINYYLSMGYYKQEGIVGGNYGQSNYERLSLRSNNIYNVMDASKERNFLNKLDVTVNMAYTRVKSTGISTNSEFGSVLGSALYMAPTLAPTVTDGNVAKSYYDKLEDPNVYDSEGKVIGTRDFYEIPRDANGNYYTIPGMAGTYQEMNNPLAMMSIPAAKNWSHKFVPKFSIDLQLWDNLKYHFTYSADLSFWGTDSYVASKYYLSGNNKQTHTSASKSSSKGINWQVENTLTYDKTIGKHSFAVVLGQSAMKNKSDYLGGSRWNLVNVNKPSIDYATGNYVQTIVTDEEGKIISVGTPTIQHSVYGGNNVVHTISSLFGRISYNYDEKYMFQATVRRDGSSRFGPGHKFGVFPSVGGGWNVHEEKFMEPTRKFLNEFKLRASYGLLGNENIGLYKYQSMIDASNGNESSFGNPNLTWETVKMLDVGTDIRLFKDLSITFDYYNKLTTDLILEPPISYIGGTKKTYLNSGSLRNRGWELDFVYGTQVTKDFSFSIHGGLSHNENKIEELFGGPYDNGSKIHKEGYALNSFYVYPTQGLLQEDDFVIDTNGDLVPKEGIVVFDGQKPGDIHYLDNNGDGKITTEDRVIRGDEQPSLNYFANLSLNFKKWNLEVLFQGVQGVDAYYSEPYSFGLNTGGDGQTPLAIQMDYWTPSNIDARYPRMAPNSTYGNNNHTSDFWHFDASYCRVKYIQLGYMFDQMGLKKIGISGIRVYANVQNPFTFSKENLVDPESRGQKSSYPLVKTYSVGVSLNF